MEEEGRGEGMEEDKYGCYEEGNEMDEIYRVGR